MAGRDLSAELFGEQKPTGGRDLSAELFGAAASPAPSSEKETSWAQHAGNLVAGAVRGAGSIGATILYPWDKANDLIRGDRDRNLSGLITGKQPISRNEERRKAMDEGLGLMGADPESGLYKTGKVGAEIAGTAGVGGVLAKGAQAVKASPAIIRALETYGLQTGATPAKFLPKLADYGTRVGAGTVDGGIASGMIDPESAGTGALIGGIIPGVAPVVTGTGRLIASATGPLRESWRTHQGNKFLQEMLGKDAVQKAIKAIAAGKGAGQTTVADDIAAANMGRTDKFASPLVAIEEKLATQPGGLSDTAKTIVARQAAAQRMALSKAAGAPSQEMAILAQGGTKGTLSTNVGPKLEQELAAANLAGKTLPRLQGQADRFATAAADKVQDVRRFTAAGERADDLAQNFFPVSGQPRIAGKYSYANELARRAERVATKSADGSLIFGEQARHSQMMADSLAKHGFKPVSGDRILSKINSEIMTPGNGDILLNEEVLRGLAKRVKELTEKYGGQLDAKSLQAMRETDIDFVVQQALSGTPGIPKERMAKTVNSLKSYLDDAIESAGGNGWKPAMKEWSAGMHDINRQKMSAKALELFDKDRGTFRSLAAGNEPGIVQDIFPVGAPVLGFQMGGKDAAIKKVASELARDAERTSLGANVDTKHLFEIADKSKGTISFPTLLSRPAMLANFIMRKVGTGADEMITQDMGKLMLSDPAAFSAKYLQEIPPTHRKMAFDTLMKHYGTPVIGVTAPVIGAQSIRSRNEQNGLLSEPTSTRRQSTSGLLN